MDIGTQILLKNALLYIQENNLEKASELLAKADRACPNSPDVLRCLSIVAAMKFDYGEALDLIDQVIVLTPNYGIAHSNRGNVLKELRRYEEALDSLNIAIKLLPSYAEAYNNKANVLQGLHRYEESLFWYDWAIKLQPSYAEAYSNKGNALDRLCRHSEAIDNYDKAIAINPRFIDAYWHKAICQLAGGNYELGWQNYEARWSKSYPITFQYGNIPRLENLENLSGKKILIWSEQGLGDTLQFCRYIKFLADLGCDITFVIQNSLMEVLYSLGKFCTLVNEIDSSKNIFDYQSPLLSLPLVFQTNIKTIPKNIPYIAFNGIKKQQFQSKLIKNKSLKVGLVWNGGFRVDHPELWETNNRRNISFEMIAKLKDVVGVDFYSLQKGNPAETEFIEKQDKLWPSIINCAKWLNDFSDTAALIENLDLVISVDTSTAHLAGALGKKVWILNRYDSCWRWLRGSSSSPWYPSAKVYNQNKFGDWDDVIERVKYDLNGLTLRYLA